MADPRLYVALDLPSVDAARAMVDALGDACVSYKIGLQLFPVGGFDLARELKAAGKHVFIDYKLHDIDATVEKATASIASLGMDLLTVHARPDVMRAAAKTKGETKVLGVTVLTSLDGQALLDIGYDVPPAELVMRRVEQALEAGIDGVVASPLEAGMIAEKVPEGFLIVTPGVRPAGADAGDQKRVATPADAMRNGATHLVVGRPVTQATAPQRAARDIADQIREL